MFNFTKGQCNVTTSGARCRCHTGRCATDPHGAGDAEALKCHSCSHRMWDHDDLLDDFDLESGSPPPYEDPASDAQRPPSPTLALPSEPAQTHYFSRGDESITEEPPLVASHNFPREEIDLPQYTPVHRQIPRPTPPPRTRTQNLVLGIFLCFVIVGTPVIAYRAMT